MIGDLFRSSTSRASATRILYPPVEKDDVGFETVAGTKARFRLDNPGEDLESALAYVSIYSDARLDIDLLREMSRTATLYSEVEAFLSTLHTLHERITKAEKQFIIYRVRSA